jgi:hypothetical protein
LSKRETDVAAAVDVAMENLSFETDFGRTEGIRVGKLNIERKDAAFIPWYQRSCLIRQYGEPSGPMIFACHDMILSLTGAALHVK